MKRILIGLGCLVVLLIAAALIVPSFIDWNAYRSEIAREVERATGRPVTIEGDLSLRILPAPAFSAQSLSLGNLEGGSQPAMVTLDEVSVAVALMPLLRGEIKVESVVLTRPVVLLERLADGRVNWDFAAAETAPPSGGSGAAEGSLPAVSLDSLRIEEGTLIYRDAASGQEERIEAVEARLSAGSLQGPLAAKGTARLRDQVVAFDLALGNLAGGGPAPAKLVLSLPQNGGEATLNGRLQLQEAAAPGFAGTLSVKGGDLAAVLAAAGGGPAPAPLAQPFELAGQVTLDETALAAEELSLVLGDNRGSGQLTYSFQPEPRLETALNLPQLDLDRLLATGRPAETAAPEPPPSAPALPAKLPPLGFGGSVSLTVDALIYRGQAIRQVNLAATIENDVVTLERTRMSLPGPSDLAFSGRLTLSQGQPGFQGALSLTSDNLRNLLAWLGVEPSGVPAERLRRLVFGSQVALQGNRLTLSDLSLQLDASSLRGALVVALGERLGLGIGLTLDRLNLDAYLPPPGPTAAGAGAGGEAPAAEDNPLAFLEAFDANLDLRAGSLTYRDIPLNDLALQGTLQGGLLTVTEGRVGELAGGRLSYRGKVAVSGPALDGTLELASGEPAKLARLAGLDPALLARLGPFGLAANLKGTLDKLDFNATLQAQGGSFTGAGTLMPEGGQLRVAVTAKHPDLPALAGRLGQADLLPAGFGPLDAAATLGLEGTAVTLRDLKGRVGPVTVTQGDATFEQKEGRPAITAELATGPLDLAALSGLGGGGSGGGGAGGERWSSAPLGLSALRDFDATLQVSSPAVTQGALRLADARLDLALVEGLLQIKRLSGLLNGGPLNATGELDARQEPQVKVSLSLADMDLAPLLEGLLPVGQPVGRLSAEGNLSSHGDSLAALIAALEGHIDAGGAVNLKTGGLGLAGGAGLGIGGQILEDLLGPEAKGLARIKNVTDGAALLVQGLADHDTPFLAKLDIAQGRVALTEVLANGRGLTARAEGFADLPPYSGDITLSVFLNDRPDEAYYRERRVGPLDDPTEVTRGGLLLSGGAPESLPDAPAPEPIQEILPGVTPPALQDLIPGEAEPAPAEGEAQPEAGTPETGMPDAGTSGEEAPGEEMPPAVAEPDLQAPPETPLPETAPPSPEIVPPPEEGPQEAAPATEEAVPDEAPPEEAPPEEAAPEENVPEIPAPAEAPPEEAAPAPPSRPVLPAIIDQLLPQ